MNIGIGRHILWTVLAGMIFLYSSCDNYSLLEKQEESFLKYYAVDIDDNTGTVVIQTTDGYAILSNFENVGGKDMILIITDQFGRQNPGYPVFFGTDRDDHGYSMIQVDNGYLISGSSTDATRKHGYLANISHDGTVLWDNVYSYYRDLEFRDACLTDDDLIITGYAKVDPGDMDAIIFKTSATGDSIWIRYYKMSDRNDVGEAIIETPGPPGRYHVITTSTHSIHTQQSRIRMLNTNKDGKAETSTWIGKEIDYLSGKDIAVNVAGNMYILGNYQDPISREYRIFLAELELTVDNQLTRLKDSATIYDPESIYGASFTTVDDHALAIGGRQVKQNDYDILFLQVDRNLQDPGVMIRKTYGSTGYQASQNIIYTIDGGFALTGSVDLAGRRTSMLLKIDSEGELR